MFELFIPKDGKCLEDWCNERSLKPPRITSFRIRAWYPNVTKETLWDDIVCSYMIVLPIIPCN